MSDGDDQVFILRVLGEGQAEYEVGDQPLIIGRDASCDVPIPSRYVSRRHARVERQGDRVAVHELGSPNPILVNGRPIEGSRVLADGDSIRIADVVVDFIERRFDPDATQIFNLEAAEVPEPKIEERASLSDTERKRIGELVRLGGAVTILFTDLENSTRVTARLGDLKAQEYLRTHNTILREEFGRHGGVEVKGFGDGFLVTFVSASAAVRCAVAIQKRLKRHNEEHPDLPIVVRAGLNIGEVISEDDDIFGTAVIVASRIMARAKGGEVMLSQLMESIIAPTGEFTTVPRGQVRLKGFQRLQRIYALDWDHDPTETLPSAR